MQNRIFALAKFLFCVCSRCLSSIVYKVIRKRKKYRMLKLTIAIARKTELGAIELSGKRTREFSKVRI